MKKITILIICLFWISLGMVGFAQNLSLSSDNPIESKTKTDVSNQYSNDIETTVVSGGKESVSNMDLSSLQDSTNNSDAQQLPVHVVMDELVFHVGFLQRKIEEKAASGRNPRGLREYYMRRAGLTDAEDQTFKSVIIAATTSLNAADNQIKAITQTYRARVNNGVRPGEPLPPIPPRLTALRNERETLLTQLPETLKTRMGEAGYQKLQTFIQREITPRIRPIMANGNRNNSEPPPSSPIQP